MKKKIERLAKGIFDYSKPEMIVSDDMLRIELSSDETKRGIFTISNSFGNDISGVVYSDCSFLRIVTSSFSGNQNTIEYEVSCPKDPDTADFSGEINIVSDAGERSIPFVAAVSDRKCKSTLGNIDDFIKFQSLASVSWCEALRIFKSDAFYNTVICRDENLKKNYDALKKSADYDIFLREFLFMTGKTVRKPFVADISEIRIDNPKGKYMYRITVKRGSRLYTRIKIETDCKAATLSDNVIDNDFSEDGTREIQIIFDTSLITGREKKYCLRLYDAVQQIKIPIILSCSQNDASCANIKKNLKKEALNLYLTYLKFRSDEDDAEFVSEETKIIFKLKETIDRLKEKSPSDELEKFEKRLWTFEKYVIGYGQKKIGIQVLVSGTIRTFLNITFMPGTDLKSLYREIIYRISEKNPSPLLLVEAGLILYDNPDFLDDSQGNMQPLFFFMIRNGLYTNEFILGIAKFLKKKNDGHISFLLLKKVYELSLDPDILFMLFKFGRKPELIDKIDVTVLKKILFETKDDTLKAEIYAYIIKNKITEASLYIEFYDEIKKFSYEKIRERLLNFDLSVIYNDILDEDMISEDTCDIIPDLNFTYHIHTDNNDFREVIVTDCHEKITYTYELKNGNADILLFTDDSEIWFKDGDGNLFYNECEIKKYLNRDELLLGCYKKGSLNSHLILYLFDRNKNYNYKPEIYSDLLKKTALLTTVCDELKNKCLFLLSLYYYDNYSADELDGYILKTDIGLLKKEDRINLIRLMAKRHMNEPVLLYIKNYGYDDIPEEVLTAISVFEIENKDFSAKKEDVVFMSHAAYKKGSRNIKLLDFLCANYYGTCFEMADIWKKSHTVVKDTVTLAENILAQVMFTESYIKDIFDIFADFYGKTSERLTVRAFLSYMSYNYFVSDEEVTEDFFKILKSDPSAENSDIMTLALLKFYSEMRVLDSETAIFCEKLIQKFIREKKRFAFFKNFEGKIKLPVDIQNRYFVEYRCDPQKEVCIHYVINDSNIVTSEKMSDSGYGFFVKPFILFHGDVLKYYITENDTCGDSENGEITESCRIEYRYEPKNKKQITKFDEINNLILASLKKNREEAYLTAKKICMNDFAAEHDFRGI